ncbi:MAG TPA: molybdate ABC transporter substrate-binding protein, partial [Burkholderiales bacterium]|nr:molybdate ABC transporter substrate-binding protein [Burkholderiales bacterium]
MRHHSAFFPGLAAALVLAGALFSAVAQAQQLTVLAAASLKNALDEVSRQYRPPRGEKISISYAGSSALAKQIENGAPAGIFISADLDWMDYLAKRDLIKSGSRVNLLRNELVLIAPAGSVAKVEIRPGFPLAALLGND